MIELTLIDVETKILFNTTLLISVQPHTRGSIVTMHGGAKNGIDFKNYYIKESYEDIKKKLNDIKKPSGSKTTKSAT